MTFLAMFGLFRAAKFWVAAIMALAQFLQVYSGVDLGLDEGTVTAILGGVGALLVWLVPNLKKKDESLPTYYPPRPDGAGLY